jgi:hypothetical protein
MANPNQYTVDGKTYYAFNEGQFGPSTTWMVRKYIVPPVGSVDDESDYVEALISVASNDPVVAINAAIQREGWA